MLEKQQALVENTARQTNSPQDVCGKSLESKHKIDCMKSGAKAGRAFLEN